MAEKTVPVFDPSGKVRQIPEDQVDAALAAGGKRAVRMSDPSGTPRWVRDSDVAAATKAGGKPLEGGLDTAAKRLFGPNVSPSTALLNTDAVKNVASHAANLVTGPAHALADSPNSAQEGIVNAVGGRGALAADRMAVEPTVNALTEARNQWKAKNIGLTKDPYDAQGNYHPTVVSSAMDAIPIVGPWARNVENEARTKGAIPAMAGLATDVVAPEVASKARAVPSFIKKTAAETVAPPATLDAPIPGDTVTPRQRYNTAKDQGVNLDTAQATNARVPAIAKKVSEHSLTGSGKFTDNTAANVAALDKHAQTITDKITPDKMSREDFGSGVTNALRQHQEFLNSQAGGIFDDLTSRNGGAQPDMAAVRDQAQRIVSDNKGYYKNHPEFLTGAPGRAWSIVNSLAEEPKAVGADGAVAGDTWSNLHKLRSDLMNMYRSPDIVGSNAEGWLKQLTGKVDESMTSAASGLSPADQAQFRQANDIYTKMKQTYDNPQSKLYHIIRSPDGLTAANSLANVTPHVAAQVGQASVDLGMPEIYQQLQRQTVERLLDPSGNGTPDLKNLPTRFSRSQKEQLGGVLTPEQINDVDDLARTSKVVHADSNPSGTAKTIQPASEAGSMIGGAGTAITGLATGNPALMAAGAAPFVEAGATRLAASKLTDPNFTESVMNPKPVTPTPPISSTAAAVPVVGAETQNQQDKPETETEPQVLHPEGKAALDTGYTTTGVPTHPAGKVTGIDEETGLPIVKRGDSKTDKPKPSKDEPEASFHPDSHVFSPSQFLQANPGADANEAAQAAQAAGYEVGE